MRLTRDAVRAEDLLQQALLVGLRRFGQLRDPSAFRVWMQRIVLRTWQNQGARKIDALLAGAAPLHEVDAAGPARDGAARRELSERLAGALAALPEGQRDAVWLVDGQGFGFAEAAELLDLRPGTVASRVARGRAALRARLRDVARAEGVIS